MKKKTAADILTAALAMKPARLHWPENEPDEVRDVVYDLRRAWRPNKQARLVDLCLKFREATGSTVTYSTFRRFMGESDV